MAQKKVEEVGAIFHNTVAVQTELYAGRDSGKLAVYSIMGRWASDMSEKKCVASFPEKNIG